MNTFADDTAVLDTAHVGDIRGALGTIQREDVAVRPGLSAKLKTLAGDCRSRPHRHGRGQRRRRVGTYTQAGQNYGTHLLWTLLLLVPVLYVNQEMVLRLGAVSGVGHARLILERFGKFWGRVQRDRSLHVERSHDRDRVHRRVTGRRLPRAAESALCDARRGRGCRRSQYRELSALREDCLVLMIGSLVADPDIYDRCTRRQRANGHEFRRTRAAARGVQLSAVMLLIIALVGTTVAPWQLFFQQSYVIDKRITPRFMNYGRVDLCIGIVIVVVGAAAMFGFSDAAFVGRAGVRQFHHGRGSSAGTWAIRVARCRRPVCHCPAGRQHHRRGGGWAWPRRTPAQTCSG